MSEKNSEAKLKKFLLLLTILITYFFYLQHKFGASSSAIVLFMTWSFFVLCTPIADAGFLLDFPLRLFLGVRMLISEIFVWVIAIAGNILCLQSFPKYYNKTFITKLFEKILTNPNPYWIIILLSFIGTFLSIDFGDRVYDKVTSKGKTDKKFWLRFAIFAAIFTATIFAYQHLLESLGIKIEL